MTKLPHDALVFIGDGRKALFLRNVGDGTALDLRTERVFADDNPPTREQGTDKPGRGFASGGSHRRSAMADHARQRRRHALGEAVLLEMMPIRFFGRSRPYWLLRRRRHSPICVGPSTPT